MQCDCDYILPRQEGWAEHYSNCSSRRTPNDKLYKNPDGTIVLQNANLQKLKVDYLYHLGLNTEKYNLVELFGDVKFVCIGGTKHRMLEFAQHIVNVLGVEQNCKPVNLIEHSHRYAMYKVGPVLSVSHGIGIPSMSVMLQELIKLLAYSKSKDPIIIRIGTSGGLGIEPGSVVVSSFGMNGVMKKSYDLAVLGKSISLPAIFDLRLAQELSSLAIEGDGFATYIGGTMAADDFYRGQARLDGPFCDHSEEEKMSFLSTLHQLGVKNIEMEATALAGLCTCAGVRTADVCVTLIDRLQGDQVSTNKEIMLEWQRRPMVLVGRLIGQYFKTTEVKGR